MDRRAGSAVGAGVESGGRFLDERSCDFNLVVRPLEPRRTHKLVDDKKSVGRQPVENILKDRLERREVMQRVIQDDQVVGMFPKLQIPDVAADEPHLLRHAGRSREALCLGDPLAGEIIRLEL